MEGNIVAKRAGLWPSRGVRTIALATCASLCAIQLVACSTAGDSDASQQPSGHQVSRATASATVEASGEAKAREGASGKREKGKASRTIPMKDRTAFALISEDEEQLSPKAKEARPGLSIMKLYIADYALRQGATSPQEFRENVPLAKRMITQSDDFAADVLFAKYPESIDAVAGEYGLQQTYSTGTWGGSYTSAYDVATYIATVRDKRPNSLIMQWMAGAEEVASDGTMQRWGTAQLDGVEGTKWGWSDNGRKLVASASYGEGFAAVAFTWGTPRTQNQDLATVTANKTN